MEKYALIVLPMLICFAALMVPILLWRWDRGRRNVRPPVSERMLRPPGESLRLKIRDLDEKADYYFMMCIVVGALLGICMFSLPVQLKRMPPVVAILMLCVLVSPWVAYYSIRAFRTLKERSNYQPGFDGERFVGELLNQLMLEDCRVFHDFPADKKGNIDHIVVAPAGVFVIETKTLRKQDAPPGKRDNTIVFDGQRLEFPHETHDYGLQQAKDNARWLSTWLGSATGEKVFVRPILAFPGWWIESRYNGEDIKVVNPKQIRSVVFSYDTTLSEEQRKRIIHQLDQKCRDVEF
jgi:Nuclease-related domain